MVDTVSFRVGSKQRKREIEEYAISQGYSSISEFLKVLIEERMGDNHTREVIKIREALHNPEVIALIEEIMKKRD